MTKEDYQKYAHVKLTDEQMKELEDRYFGHAVYAIEGQSIMIDGSINPIKILAAADYIRSLFPT